MNELTEKFISLCSYYAESKENVLYHNHYGSDKLYSYFIELSLLKIEFRYIEKESSLNPPSSLYCIIYLHKNSDIHYHLIDILPYLKEKNLNRCYFSAIESTARLETSFKELTAIIDSSLEEIEELAANDSEIKEKLFTSYKAFYKLKEKDLDSCKVEDPKEPDHNFFIRLQKNRDKLLLMRFSTASGYADLLRGNTAKAIRFYKKQNEKGYLFDYEKLLLERLTSDEGEKPRFISEQSNSQELYNSLGRFSSYVKAFFAVYIPATIVFSVAFILYNNAVSSDALFVFGAPWHVATVPAGLCAIFGAISFFAYMPNRKISKEQRKELIKILIPKWLKIISPIVFGASIAVSIFFAVAIIGTDLRFYEDRISCPRGEFISQHYDYIYDEIDSVYYINARYNPYGDRLERASYVILLKDKTVIDFDGYASVEQTEEKAIPLLKSKGFNVTKVDSDRDLPWYN